MLKKQHALPSPLQITSKHPPSVWPTKINLKKKSEKNGPTFHPNIPLSLLPPAKNVKMTNSIMHWPIFKMKCDSTVISKLCLWLTTYTKNMLRSKND
jgi:hypothetical protein